MKIVIFSHTSGLYGAELALLEMVDVLKTSHDCTVFLPQEGPLANKLREKNVNIEISKYRWWAHEQNDRIPKIFARFFINIIESVIIAYKTKKHAPDLIISNTAVINTGMISSMILRKPHLWIIHEFVVEDHGLIFDLGQSFTMKCIGKFSNTIVTVSKTLYAKYVKYIKPEKLEVVYFQNMKNISTQTPSWPISTNKDEDILKLLIVGSISESKGQYLAIDAINILKKEGVEKLQLLIVGGGKEKYIETLKRKVGNYRLDNQVYFLGYINNPYPIIMASDSLLMLSRCEAFGRTTIEGMSYGKVVIASDSGSGTELICNNANGLLYNNGSADDLALKIKELYNNRKILEEIGTRARNFAIKFNNPKEFLKNLNKVIIKTTQNNV